MQLNFGPIKFRPKYWLMTAGLCLIAAPIFATPQNASQQPSGDSVADAARKAREEKEKKNAAKPKKVYTDDDLNHGSSGSANVPADNTGNAQSAAEPSQASAANGTTDKNGEAAWRKRFKDQNEKIAKAEKELDLLQREQNKSGTQYYSDPQKALMEQYSRKEINDRAAKIEAKKQEIAKLKQGLDDMEEELRKSGGDPGWAR